MLNLFHATTQLLKPHSFQASSNKKMLLKYILTRIKWIGYFQYFTTQQQPDFRKHMKNYSILKLPNILENVDDLILGYVKAQTYF